ncbi:MAG: preprotein translocase subunit YajC [Alphaproteobacteria bacterium]|nr:preprotein translocase subunit YajC [Alphaproteobacteria bacterium]
MFISSAFAQTTNPASTSTDLLTSMLPLLLVFLVFYVLLILPQKKKMQAHRAMLAALRRGDRVLTSGGIIATVHRLNDGAGEVEVEIAEGVKVLLARHTILEVLTKTEPANSNAEPKAKKSASVAKKANDGQ